MSRALVRVLDHSLMPGRGVGRYPHPRAAKPRSPSPAITRARGITDLRGASLVPPPHPRAPSVMLSPFAEAQNRLRPRSRSISLPLTAGPRRRRTSQASVRGELSSAG